MRRLVGRVTIGVLACSVAISVAPAQPHKPWEAGTTSAQRDEAHRLFARGNESFSKSDFARALALYEQAVAIFDHARIRLAMARALISLGRPADAYRQIQAALRWGRAPFDADEYGEAVAYQNSLARRVGTVVIRCTTPDAHLTLDGQDLLACPGEVTYVVMPGRHQVVGKKPGLLTYSEAVAVDAGKTVSLEVALKAPRVVVKAPRLVGEPPDRRKRVAAIIVGAFGVAAGGAATAFAIDSKRQSDKLDGYQGEWGDAQRAIERRGRRDVVLAYVAGGTAVASAITAGVLLWLGRDRRELAVDVAALPGGAAASWTVAW